MTPHPRAIARAAAPVLAGWTFAGVLLLLLVELLVRRGGAVVPRSSGQAELREFQGGVTVWCSCEGSARP